MLLNKIFASFRSRFTAAIILLSGLIFLVAYIYNLDLLWLLMITIPCLAFAIYKFYWKKNASIDRYFRRQKVNAIYANSERLSQPASQIKVNKNDLIITIGNDECKQPYRTSVYNIRVRDMFRQGVAQKVITDLPETEEEEQGAFTEESPTYHLVGGDKVMQIGPRYLGCRNERGDFDAGKFKELACQDATKMVELDLSSVAKETNDIVTISGRENPDSGNGRLNISSSGFTAFSDAEGMTHFIDTLRRLSGCKPIGIRICIGEKKEFYRTCHSIVKTRVMPDFIVVEGADKKPDFSMNHFGMTLYEALLFVSKTLQSYGLDKNIKVIASADINSGFDVLKMLALGANAVCSQMPAYNHIQYHRNDSKQILLYRNKDVVDFHEYIINATARMMEANKIKSISDITIAKLLHRLDVFLAKKQLDTYDYKKLSASAKVFMSEH